MNKFTVIAKNKETYFIKRLTEEVGEDSICILDPWQSQEEAFPVGAILVRTTGVYGGNADLDFLETRCRRKEIINPLEALSIFRSKLSQYELFGRIGIPQVPWLDLRQTDVSVIMSFIQNFPVPRYIIKPHRGQGGWGIKAMTPRQIYDWYESSSDREYILQPCIEGAREFRFFFIGDKLAWTIERFKARGEVAANFQLEGEARRVDTDPRFEGIIRQIRSTTPVHYGALDILVIENEIFVLELNVVPGIQQMEKVLGINVMRCLLESF